MEKHYRYIGKPLSNADAYGKVTGSLLYCKDRMTEKTLHIRLAHAKFAHGMIEDVDTSKAEAVEGVIKVQTAPVQEHGDYESCACNCQCVSTAVYCRCNGFQYYKNAASI